MITANFYSRVLRIRFGDNIGTAFLCNYKDSEYLVTAEHIVKDGQASESLGIEFNQTWHNISSTRIGVGSDYDKDYDVAVFKLHQFTSPSDPMPIGLGHAIVGDDTYFLGFPYEMTTGRELQKGWPLPLVKKATYSGHDNDSKKIVLDGHNNPGFSGGPVLIKPNGKFPCTVGGVISSYRKDYSKVMNCNNWFEDTGLMAEGNSGLIFATSATVIMQIIDEMN